MVTFLLWQRLRKMCGLVGYAVKDPKDFDLDLLIRMSLEAQIRGQHACGIAIITHDGYLNVWQHPFPIDQVNWDEFEDFKIRAAIVHTRYSTSDLHFNQPNYTTDSAGIPETALIHNGVVTQSDPKRWFNMFGVNCATKNDSEILAHLYAGGVRHPLSIQPSSQACVVLDNRDSSIRFWRNEERPLYYFFDEHRLVVASTWDILLRSNACYGHSAMKCNPCVEYALSLDTFRLPASRIREPKEDLQP
jgi:glutamine phosphoribosylpyrophosphate amidotransferase